jgi:hypothetical protein
MEKSGVRRSKVAGHASADNPGVVKLLAACYLALRLDAWESAGASSLPPFL